MTESLLNNRNNDRFDEFSPRELLIQTKFLFAATMKKWPAILSFSLILGIGGAAYCFFKKPTYSAELTFALDEGAASAQQNSTGQLQEEPGFNSTTVQAGGVFSSLPNIVELIKSRLLIENSLRKDFEYNGKTISYIDFFLDSLDYRDKWLKGTPYSEKHFPLTNKLHVDTIRENEVIRDIYELMVKRMITVSAKGTGSTIIATSLVTENELFSKYFLETLIAEVTRFYVDTKTQRAKRNLDFIQKRTDSTRAAYTAAIYGRANFTDAHQNPALQVTTVPGEKQQTSVQILRAAYIDLERSLENAKTTLMRETPLIQYLDEPILPLKKANPSMMKYFLVLLFLGAALSITYIALRIVLKKILNG